MADYVRTAIRRLSISGFRSIRSLDLENIPDLVVLHGPNGAGKSNLLLGAQLVLKAAQLQGDLPSSRDAARTLSLDDADKLLGLRPDDFHFGVAPEIRVFLNVSLGAKASEIVGARQRPLGELSLEVVVQRASEGELRYWFERADAGKISLGLDGDPTRRATRQQLESLRSNALNHRANIAAQEDRLASLDTQPAGRQVESQRIQARAQIRTWTQQLQAVELQQRHAEATLGEDAYLSELIRWSLIPRLIQVSPAYRVPGGEGDPQRALYRAFLSDDRLERAATRRLSRRLASAGLFGSDKDAVELLPINNTRYGEQQILFTHPTHGDLSFRNLGSGEQQVVYMLAQRVITPFPIAHIEEPEAHLHPSLMKPLAQVLSDSVAGDGGMPDVDQLWIATHHHYFALALQYFDVHLVDGATTVTRTPRAKAGRHYYEPGPIWEALRQLAASAKERDAVVFRNAAGEAVTAGQILDSIDKDPAQRLATEYAEKMTEAMVLAMRQRAESR